jgi:hypothetical protein
MKSIFLSFLWIASVVRSAINPDGTQAIEPVTDDDASPIANMATYYPDLHDCPLKCEDLTNTNSWITLGPSNSNDATISPELLTVENPKKDEKLYLPSAKLAPACSAESIETQDQVQIITSNSRSNGSSSNFDVIDDVLGGMSRYFAAKDNCVESFIFAYHEHTLGAVYVGQAISKSTVISALQAFRDHISSKTTVASRTIA